MKIRSMLWIAGVGLSLGLTASGAFAATKSPAMSACSDDWASMKKNGKVAEGQTWPKFWSQCSKDYATAHPEVTPAAMTPAKPAAATLAAMAPTAATSAPLAQPEVAAKANPDKATTRKRELTSSQKAAIVRVKACGAEWQASKKAKTLPEGAKWPQYWNDCNKRLKAKGP